MREIMNKRKLINCTTYVTTIIMLYLLPSATAATAEESQLEHDRAFIRFNVIEGSGVGLFFGG